MGFYIVATIKQIKMKKLMTIALMLFFAVASSNAQATLQSTAQVKQGKSAKHIKATPEQRAQNAVAKLDKVVTLTADQKTKVQALAIERAKKVDEVRAKYKGQENAKEAAKADLAPIRKEFRKNVKALLTPEQLQKLKAKAKEQKTQNDALDKDE